MKFMKKLKLITWSLEMCREVEKVINIICLLLTQYRYFVFNIIVSVNIAILRHPYWRPVHNVMNKVLYVFGPSCCFASDKEMSCDCSEVAALHQDVT